MESLITRAQGISLGDEDILKFCDGKLNVWTSPQLNEVSSIDEMLGEYGACAILYETEQKSPNDVYGHWCCVTKRSQDTCEFMDPYGLRLDDELKFVPEEYMIKTGQYARLSELINDPSTPYRFVYNHEKLQQHKKGVDTCGRYVALRIKWKSWPLIDFQRVLKSGTHTPDFWVTALTLAI